MVLSKNAPFAAMAEVPGEGRSRPQVQCEPFAHIFKVRNLIARSDSPMNPRYVSLVISSRWTVRTVAYVGVIFLLYDIRGKRIDWSLLKRNAPSE